MNTATQKMQQLPEEKAAVHATRGEPVGDLYERLVFAFSEIYPGVHRDFGMRADKIGDDERILNQFLEAGCPRTFVRLWDNDRRLVISRRLARLPFADLARAESEVRGWPVSIRASGGTTVAHGPGVLNVSFFWVSREPIVLRTGFDRLCGLITDAARSIGIELSVGCHTGAYCAGSHDIGWQGRKVAGTAGLARRSGQYQGAVFHASVLVSCDYQSEFKAICQFERSVGLTASYNIDKHSTIQEIAKANAKTDDGFSRALLHKSGSSGRPITFHMNSQKIEDEVA